MKMERAQCLATVLALSLFGVACGDSTGPNAETASVSLSISVPQAAAAPVSIGGPFAVITQDDGENTLVISRAAVIVREIQLHRQGAVCMDSTSGDDDDCEEFEVGPFLTELPVDGTVRNAFSVVAPAGVYDRVDFKVHKPDDDTPSDLEFLNAHPEFVGVSVRVEGTFNGTDFVFLQDLNEEQEISLIPAIVVDETTEFVNVTLEIDVATWFMNGSTLIDPVSANKGNEFEALVEANIQNSIDAFEDNDRDGVDDDDPN